MQIELKKSAVKDLKAIPNAVKTHIHNVIAELVNFPHVKQIKKLTQFEPAYRLRVGDYRILFDVEDDKILIGRVLHRKESYKKL
ncbi:MAG: type II toxin-antitoxin system RelE/ParE family toxin [Methylococcales bacterium]|nr:type II toxin-antitoxin system RelE/ParE family toxin [Methylococcales bacterium]